MLYLAIKFDEEGLPLPSLVRRYMSIGIFEAENEDSAREQMQTRPGSSLGSDWNLIPVGHLCRLRMP